MTFGFQGGFTIEKVEANEDIIKVLQEALDKKDAGIKDKETTILELREELT